MLFAIFMVFSCSKEEINLLNHDGENRTAPFLPAGTHILGIKFEANELVQFIGRRIEEIHFYMVNIPSNALVQIYGEGANNSPGPLILSIDIGSNMASDSWNAYIIDTPIEITGEVLWFCIAVTHDSNTNSLGCDAGPADVNGDWILAEGSSDWETFRNYTSEAVNINWNIRAILNN